MGKRKMKVGDKHGRLTLVEWIDCRKSKFMCDCGNECLKTPRDVKHGKTRSCGCIRAEKPNSLKHGDSSERLYLVWKSMKQRCLNKNNKDYKQYGARGITVCKEWTIDYLAFKAWAIANGYASGTCIDRIDNALGYAPDNCRWVSNKENCNNTRTNRKITYNGTERTLSEWAGKLGMPSQTLSARLNSYGWTIERALTEPVHKNNA